MKDELTDKTELKNKMNRMARLLIECRDALPAISMVSARLNNIDLGLASRIEDELLPWEVKDGKDGEEGI